MIGTPIVNSGFHNCWALGKAPRVSIHEFYTFVDSGYRTGGLD